MATYPLFGVCSNGIELEIDDDNIIQNVVFYGGCNANLKAISRLVKGKDAQEVADTLRGNTCGLRPTSCADQFAHVIDSVLAERK